MEQGFIGAHCDGVGFHILAADINRHAHGNAKTFSLAQSIADCAFVRAYHIAVHVQIIAAGAQQKFTIGDFL